MSIQHRFLSLGVGGIFLVLITLSLRLYPQNFRSLAGIPTDASRCQKKVVSEDYSSEYRKLLSTVDPMDRIPHSKTLGVASRIYVIGLPRRQDRRLLMEKLARAMGEQN